MMKQGLLLGLMLVLAASPALANRELRHLPFGFGKGKGKGAPPPVVAAAPTIVAAAPQVVMQPQFIPIPYVAAAPQMPPVVAAAPQPVPPPPRVEFVPVPTPPVYVPVPGEKEIIVKEKVVVKKVPVMVPVKKHHFLPLKIAGLVAKSVLSNMEHNEQTVEENEDVTFVPTPVPTPVPVPVPVPTFAVNDTALMP